MRTHRGFTVVELVVVMAIMAILLTLGMINIQSSRANARDSERKSDIEMIQNGLERYYADSSQTTGARGSYPDISIAATLATNQILPDTPAAAFTYASKTDQSIPSFYVSTRATTSSVGATTTYSYPLPTIEQFIYEPLMLVPSSTTTSSTTSYWRVCTAGQQCDRYRIYYRLENAPNTTVVLESKHQ